MTEQKKRRRWLLLIPVALVSVLALQFRSGIQVTVENIGGRGPAMARMF